jgi:protoporphyrinogen oxidase
MRTGVASVAPGFTVALSGDAESLSADAPGFTVALSGDAEALSADAVVLAVGPSRMADLLPDGTAVDPESLRALGESPIVNVHVVYDRPVLDVPFAAGVGTPVQWVFDRSASHGVSDGQYLVVTVSAADEELGIRGEAIVSRYLAALGELLPAAREASVVRAFVTRDHAATFRAAPGQRALRPAAATALPGLALAGAHTDTGWPATMEGAIRSGRAAAEVVLAGARAAADVSPAPSAAAA